MTKSGTAPISACSTTELLPQGDLASWDDLVTQSPHGTVFHYSWWLEATGYEFEVLVCRDRQGQLEAGIPLPRKIRGGLTLFHSPRLTPYLGPIFDLSKAAKPYDQLSLMRRLGESLARAIKGFDSLVYGVGAQGPDLQGFLWTGFRAELGYTFRFEAGVSVEQIRAGMAPKHRHEITKAERRHLYVEVQDNIEAFLELNKQTFARQGESVHYEESLVRRLWASSSSRGCGKIYLARSSVGVDTAGLLVVHDPRTSYLLLAGGNPEMRASGGGNLVEWHAIQDAIMAGRAFDFEGSAIRGVEQHYRHWGAAAKPVWRLVKPGTWKGALAQMLFWRRS